MEHKRNYSIDLLRLVSMFMVVLLHFSNMVRTYCIGHPAFSAEVWNGLYLIRAVVYSCVDVFALISGFVGWKSKVRFSRLAEIWLQILYHTVLITLLFAVFAPQHVTPEIWQRAFLPITRREYWYTTKFFVLYCFLPLLHFLLQHISCRVHGWLSAALLIGCSLIPTLLDESCGMHYGYSAAWLGVCYVLGAWLERSGLTKRVKAGFGAAVCAVSALAAWLIFLCFDNNTDWIAYTSPLTLLTAVGLVLMFAAFKIDGSTAQRLIRKTAPTALSVFVIHVHTLPWQHILPYLPSRFGFYRKASFWWVLCRMTAASVAVFAVCVLLDLIRLRLFRALKVGERLAKAEEGIIGFVTGKKRGRI